ncbi:MAG: carboxy terminal-processing peptidase [Pirellulales bacterium]|nr:carboxy terminal-processing peptidase [Pirellulales bacterium]
MAHPSVSKNRRRLACVLLAVFLVSGIGLAVCADPITPSAKDRQIALTVTSLLKREHLSKHKLDDEISERCFQMFLKSLDPMKLYFYQSDIDGFQRQQKELDDAMRRGDVKFAYDVFTVFLRRIDERVAVVDRLLAMNHDFTLEEEMGVDRDTIQYAKNEAEANDRWRKRIKYDLLVLKADKIEGQAAIEKLTRRYHSFAKRMHQTDDEELLEMYLTAMTTSFDPHTTYMAPSTLDNFDIAMRLELDGIGAALQAEDGFTVVKEIIPGGAADKDGRLKPGDKVVGVGQGANGEIEDVVDLKLSDVVKLIRGKKGTVVRLQVVPAESTDRKIIEITRAKIELKDKEARAHVFDAGKKADGQPYKVGVIELPSFYMDMSGARLGLPDFKSSTRDVRRILEDFTAKGVDAVVLDLRRNGGGSLQEAINLTGLFIDRGPVVQVKDSDGRITPYNDVEAGTAWEGPLVVLISKFSASASEILAGAIQDYGRGLIVGDHTTHGKGTVQSLMDLAQTLFRLPNMEPLGALKITMQQFYRPNGDSTQNRGVVSDLELPSLTTHLDVGEKDLDYPVAFDQVQPLEFPKLGYVNGGVVNQLQTLSAQRRQNSEDFRKVTENIARYNEQKDRKAVTLNEAKFMKERAELNADKEEEKKLEELNDSGGLEIKRDYYLDEALAITADYLSLLGSAPPAQAVQATAPRHAAQAN